MTANASMKVTPDKCLMDEPVAVTMQGLEKNTIYTLYTRAVDCKDEPFFSCASYKSDDDGKIDLTKTPAQGGHYNGLLPMAPFAHLIPEKKDANFPRFSYSDTYRPISHEMSLYPGPVAIQLVNLGATACGMTPVCSCTHVRLLVRDSVKRVHVRSGKVRGILYIPKGDGPFPGVVDMFGAAGGVFEHRAALFASRGFLTLALAYFAYEDLQESMDTGFDLSYFDEAVQYLHSRPEVRKVGVGVIGSSKAGDLALSMATNVPQVKAAIIVNGCVSTIGAGTRLKDGSELPTMSFDPSKIMLLRNGAMQMLEICPDPRDFPETIIPVEKSYADMLWLCGEDDKGLNSCLFAEVARERCEKAGVPHKIKVLTYPGTGHLLEPAYIPFLEQAMQEVSKIPMMWGGNAVQHTKAQELSWKATQDFFNEKLK